MTSGPIYKQLLLFALPLLLGNAFQLLYNMVDTFVVGNYVSTNALAAVGSTTMIVNMMVFFFGGLSLGCTVVISQSYGAGDDKTLHAAVETAITMTFILSIVFTVGGMIAVPYFLRFMDTPESVLPDAILYLRVYFSGATGLLIYNMGSGILRAVGDTTRPLYFLIFTSLLNTALDLLLVLVFHMGVAGVALATIFSQFVSAALVLLLLSRTTDIYRLTWSDLHIDARLMKRILGIGLPAAVQSILTAFSNIFVQSYINVFGAVTMAGWACFNKLDQFLLIPMQSMAGAATTFVGQNIGAGKEQRASRGTVTALLMAEGITVFLIVMLYVFAEKAAGVFTSDASVVVKGVYFMRLLYPFRVFSILNQVLAGAMRGRGDSRIPTYFMLVGFVLVRQTYLYIVTHYVANTEFTVGIGYPVGWFSAACLIITYYLLRYGRRKKTA